MSKIFECFLTTADDTGGILGACKSNPSGGANSDDDEEKDRDEDDNGVPRVKISLLQLGAPAPNFQGTAVVNKQFKDIKLKDYKGKYVVLFFYPLDFTFVCPTEIIAFNEAYPEFKKLNCELIAASTDSHFGHFAWVSKSRKEGGLGDMDIPLLGDKSAKVARAYGVYNEKTGIAYRGLFIIDERQRLRQITINDLQVGRSVDETLRLVQAFQYSDRVGEGCPANWKPGIRSIRAEPEEAKKYFDAVNSEHC